MVTPRRLPYWIALLVPLLLLITRNSLSDTNVQQQETEMCAGFDGTSETCEQQPLASTAIAASVSLDDGEDMGVAQEGARTPEVQVVLQRARTYLETKIFADPQYTELRDFCKNQDDNCAIWASEGECEANPAFMNVSCGPVCQTCEYLGDALEYGEDMGVTQEEFDDPKIQEILQQTRQYLRTVVYPHPEFISSLRESCQNKDPKCAFWASEGECEGNAVYMNTTCAPVCQSCEFLLINVRCPLDPNAVDFLKPGDLNQLFERIITQPEYSQYQPLVLSRPDLLPDETEESALYRLGPWVVQLENFVSQEEADRLIELGRVEGYERSGNVGQVLADGTLENFIDESRTSNNAWCRDVCYNDTVAKAAQHRIVNLTGVNESNIEYLQMLKYEVGQYYQTHHDMILQHLERQPGVRVLTVFIYLNEVEEGGGTNFPLLNLTVTPKRGRVIIWPSVLDENPNEIDNRTDHQALPVVRGIKYGANAWIHQRDFKTPNSRNCV